MRNPQIRFCFASGENFKTACFISGSFFILYGGFFLTWGVKSIYLDTNFARRFAHIYVRYYGKGSLYSLSIKVSPMLNLNEMKIGFYRIDDGKRLRPLMDTRYTIGITNT